MNKDKMDKIRINNMLNKPMRFNGIYFNSWEKFFIKNVVKVESYKSNNMDKWDRIKFNRMDNNKEQDIYTSKLQQEITKYKAILQDGSFIDISKFLYEGFKSLFNGLNINWRV